MSTERFVALGFAGARAGWFTDVARWATSGALALDFVKCVSVEEVRARLASGRRFSVLLADGSAPGVDRDLIATAQLAEVAVIVIDDLRVERDWRALGAATVLPQGFDRGELNEALDGFARPILDAATAPRAQVDSPSTGWRGRVVAVTGPGGTGASVLSMALASCLAKDVRFGGSVALADLALDADQGVLHDARDLVPGVQELVDAHRSGRLEPDEIRACTFEIPAGGYSLLLGLRRHRDWTAIRPQAFDAALDGFRRSFRMIVADIDADLEGEEDCGSMDVEERNHMARSVVEVADLVVVVGGAGISGIHRLVRVLQSFVGNGVPADRLLPVVNRAPRSMRQRAEIARAVAELVGLAPSSTQLPAPVFVPERRRLDEHLQDGSLPPSSLAAGLDRAVHATIERAGEPESKAFEPRPRVREGALVAPGSLGRWAEDSA